MIQQSHSWVYIPRIYAIGHCSAIKKNETIPLAAIQMGLEIIILSEVSQRQRSYDITSVQNPIFLNDRNELNQETETDLQILKTSLWLPKGKYGWAEGIDQELGINIYTLLYIRQITNKDLLHSTENTI